MNELYVRHRAEHGRVVSARYQILDAKTNPRPNSKVAFYDRLGRIVCSKKPGTTQQTKGKKFVIMKDPSQIYDLLIHYYESLGFQHINICEGAIE